MKSKRAMKRNVPSPKSIPWYVYQNPQKSVRSKRAQNCPVNKGGPERKKWLFWFRNRMIQRRNSGVPKGSNLGKADFLAG